MHVATHAVLALSEAGRQLEELPPGALRRLRDFIRNYYASLDEEGQQRYDQAMMVLAVLMIPFGAFLCACCQSCLYAQAQKPYRRSML